MRRTRVPTALAAAALLVAACSGSDGEGAPTTPAAGTVDTTVPVSSVASTAAPTTSAAPTTTGSLAPGAIGFTRTVTGLTKPVDIAFRAGDDTVYVAQQDGRVVPLVDGAPGPPVLDISGKISTDGEQGLLGLAFHPTRPRVYIDYTNAAGDTVVAELTVNEDGSWDATSERQVLTVDQPYRNHNGGELVFGLDGYLYIGLGDGGSGGDPQRRALDLDSMLGKILRIDPLASDTPYTVPADNPFVGRSGARPEIWSYGLRNPWRFDFDRETGDLWIADVGQDQWEEVDVSPAGAGGGKGVNFGWSALEGTHPFNADQDADGAAPPIWEYPHGDDGCSVSGGTVYRGTAIPSLVGAYVVADYCSGNVWALQPSTDFTTADVVALGRVNSPSAVVAAPGGELWVLDHGDGAIYALTPA